MSLDKNISNLFRKGLVIIIITLVVIAMGLYFPCEVAAAETAVVSISAPGQTIYPGEHFSIGIIVEPGNAIAGVQFNLNFDPTLVTIDNIQEGDLLTQNGASTFFIPGVIDSETGKITGAAGAIITPGQVVSTGGTFAIINLVKSMNDKACLLDLSNVVVGDIEGNPLPVDVIDTTINQNHSPVIDPIEDKYIEEGEQLLFTVAATDLDGDELQYSVTNLPSGASFDPSTRTFSWTPDFDQSGVYTNVYFEVSDSITTDSTDVAITVRNANSSHGGCDVNGDGLVNVSDLIRVTHQLGKKGQDNKGLEDVNRDGTVNVLDIIQIIQHWTRGQSEYHRNMHS